MRTIKFRAWDKRKKEMFLPSTKLAICFDGLVVDYEENCDYENQSIVLMQFTGLLDRNGKEIYEGDIVQIEGFDDDSIGITEVKIPEIYRHPLIMEVLGNIYENPELLNQ